MTDEELPALSARTRSREELADYLLEIGTTLASYGCPSYRLEDVIRTVADTEGYRAEPFALPTGLFLRLVPKAGIAAPEVHRMARLGDWGVDLTRLTEVDAIFNDVALRRTTIEQARARIRAVVEGKPAWPVSLVWAASAASSAAAAVFFRGGFAEVVAAAIIGTAIGGARIVLVRPAQRLLTEFIGGVLSAIAAWVMLKVSPGASPEIVVLAGAISLFPGMTFTTGLAEVAQKNVIAGGGRLMESAVTLLLIVFGVALVAGVQALAGGAMPPPSTPVGLPLPWQAAALVLSSLSFGIFFQVPRRYLWAALASGATGYAATALAMRHFPGHVAAFCAALCVCALANALARFTQRPAQLFQLPGMTLLVPGSFGFSSLGDFLRRDVTAGAEKGFTMALVGAALVIGVLLANVLVPSRKLL